MILNRQRRLRVPLALLERFLERVQRTMHVPPDSLTVGFVSDAQIAHWNHVYRGKNGPTDMLAFPAREINQRDKRGRREAKREGRESSTLLRRGNAFSSSSLAFSSSSTSYFGDIAIAPAIARRNARRFGRTFEEEMCLLILHGALHLMGYDHERDHGEMNRVETRLRRRLGLA